MHGILSCMNSDTPFEFGRLPRLTSWWVIALALSALVFLLAPQQLPVSIYKLNLIALAAVAGYWIDRSASPYGRPRVDALRSLDAAVVMDWPPEVDEPDMAAPKAKPDAVALYFMLGCMLRRSVIMSATIVAVGLGA
jgi:hypothetical protein